MSKSRHHPLAGFDAHLGNLVFYHFKGKSCVRRAPVRGKPFTDAEQSNQSRFMLASKFAKSVLHDPQARARYDRAALETGHSAQNLAVSDFMRSPALAEIDLSQYRGHTGEFIKVTALEGHVGAAEVKVTIKNDADQKLEEGLAAVETDGVSWWYSGKLDLPPNHTLWITVTARDQPGNSVSKTLRHTAG